MHRASELSSCLFVRLFVCLSVCCQIAKNAIFSKTKQFRAVVSINDLWEVVHGLFKEPIIGPLKSKITEIRHLGSWRQNAKTRFSQKLSNLELVCLLTTYRKLCKLNWAFKELIIGSLQSKMAEIRHLKNRHEVIFFCQRWSDLDKISQTGTEWHADVWANSMACHLRATYHIAGCCHLVNLLSWFQSHMPHCRVQSPDEINVVIVPHCRV